mgnify:CR=1 FL=1
MRTWLVAMTNGRTDRASAVCVDDGEQSAGEVAKFMSRYKRSDVRRVTTFDEMQKLMTAE